MEPLPLLFPLLAPLRGIEGRRNGRGSGRGLAPSTGTDKGEGGGKGEGEGWDGLRYHDPVSSTGSPPPIEIIDDPLRLTAYHEAGHAVMAQLCGRRITEVEIVGDEDHTGSVRSLRFTGEHPSEHDPALPTAPIERRLLCTAAGLVAESMVSGRRDWDEGSEDLDLAVGLAMKVVGDCERVIPFLGIVREHTEDLLQRNWQAVEALAETLVKQRRMTGDEVRRLLRPLLPS